MTCDKANGTLQNLINNNNNNLTTDKGTGKMSEASCKKSEVPLLLEEDIEKRKSLVILLSIFAAGLLALFYIYKNFPEIEE